MKFLTTQIQKKLTEYFDKMFEICNYKFQTKLNIDTTQMLSIVKKLSTDFNEMSKRMSEEKILSSNEFLAILSYRVLNFLIEQFYEEIDYHYIEKEKNLSFLKSMIRKLSESNRALTGIEINPFAKIDSGFCIIDGNNCVIGERCVIGTNFTMHKGVVLGVRPNDSSLKIYKTKEEKDFNRHPKIGNNVEINENAKILGNIHIGNNVIIGNDCTILKSMPDDATITTYQSMQLYRYKNESIKKPKIYLIKYDYPRIIIKGTNLGEITTCLIDPDNHHELAKQDIRYDINKNSDEINITITKKNEMIKKIGLLLSLNEKPKLLIRIV